MMCKQRDSIDAVSAAARGLELACQGKGRRACDKLLQDPAPLKHLPAAAVDFDALLAAVDVATTQQGRRRRWGHKRKEIRK